jgi:hypothetical protein
MAILLRGHLCSPIDAGREDTAGRGDLDVTSICLRCDRDVWAHSGLIAHGVAARLVFVD